MKKIVLTCIAIILVITSFSQTGSVGIGTTTPSPSAALEIQNTNKGILIPRMSSIQRNAIPTPATGLLVFDNTTESFWYRNSTGWVELIDTAKNVWKRIADSAYVDASVNVGIGTASPEYDLDIRKNNPSIGLRDMDTDEFSGFISGNGKDLNIIASRVILGQGTPGNLILQSSSGFALGGNVGIGAANPSYKLDITGSARITDELYVNNSLWVDEDLDVDSNLVVGAAASIHRNLTVNNGKGIVRSTNGFQQVVAYPVGTLGFTNAPPGHTQDVEFSLPNVFSGDPVISVAQVNGMSGTFERWVLTIHTIDIDAHKFTVRFFNAGTTPSTFLATYRFIAIGPAL